MSRLADAPCLRVERSRRKPDRISVFVSVSRRYWMDGLPPCPDRDRLAFEIGMIAETSREDAVQVSWLAWLEGREPARAVNTWWASERRRRVRERTNEL